MLRTVTLVGPSKAPSGCLTRIASTYVNATGSGLVEAAQSLCDDGDFQSARLTGDSCIRIEHRRRRPDGWTSRVRVVDVTNLSSLADYVAADSYALAWGEES